MKSIFFFVFILFCFSCGEKQETKSVSSKKSLVTQVEDLNKQLDSVNAYCDSIIAVLDSVTKVEEAKLAVRDTTFNWNKAVRIIQDLGPREEDKNMAVGTSVPLYRYSNAIFKLKEDYLWMEAKVKIYTEDRKVYYGTVVLEYGKKPYIYLNGVERTTVVMETLPVNVSYNINKLLFRGYNP